MLPPTLSKYCMCMYYKHFVVDDHDKQIQKLKNKKVIISSYSVKLPVALNHQVLRI